MFKDISAGFLFLLLLCLDFSDGSNLEKAVRIDNLKEMRNYINESVDPCENFYEFACGGSPQHQPAREFHKIDFNRQFGALVMSDKDENDTKVDRALKDFYKSCFNLPNPTKHYRSILKDLIGEFGQMPALAGNRWNEGAFDWQQIVGDIKKKYGIRIIVSPYLIPDVHNSTETAVHLSVADFILTGHKSTYSDGEIRSTVIANLVKYLGLGRRTARKVFKEMFDFEQALTYGVRPFYDDPDVISTTIEEIERKYSPILDGKKLIETVYGSVPPFNIYEDRLYLKNAVDVLEMAPKRVVANYIFYKFISEFIFERQDDEESQHNFCLEQVKRYFPKALEGLLYRRWYSTQQTKADLDDMWQKIKEAFEDTLKSPRLSWMAENTRAHALEKLHAMRLVVPALEGSILDEVEINEYNYIANVAKWRVYFANKNRYEKEDESEAQMSIRCFSDRKDTPLNILNENVVSVPVYVLKPNYLMDHALPTAFTFGKLGSLLAHEVLHGFDYYGSRYDKTGKQLVWWDTQSVQKLKEAEQCFMDQFNDFTFAGLRLENYDSRVAENGGVHLAYLAYLKWYQDSSRTPQELASETIPRLPYTNKQLFFIGYGQNWCTKPPKYHDYAPEGAHIHLTLWNLEEFSEDFSCPRGSAMNPNHKCQMY